MQLIPVRILSRLHNFRKKYAGNANLFLKIVVACFLGLVVSQSKCLGCSFPDDFQVDSVQSRRVSNVQRVVTSPSICLYAEMYGAGAGMVSIHGEATAFRFTHKTDGFGLYHSLRFSIGYSLDGFFLPIAAKFILFESDHHLETGIGLTFPIRDRGGADGYPAAAAMGIFILGYRYEPQAGGFLFRVNYTPVIDTKTGEINSFFYGLSIGIAL